MIKGTVALPVYNSNKITWLVMESLCNQIKPVDGWELIVYEELHTTMLGSDFFDGYKERLLSVGCERITYLSNYSWVPLPVKWVEIAKVAEGEYYCMCATDNYYHPWMLVTAEDSINQAPWSLMNKGYFYDLDLDKVIGYDYNSVIGLCMSARTELVKKFEHSNKKHGIDGWFYSQMRVANGKPTMSHFVDASDHWKYMLCTNGLNNISKKRYECFLNPSAPFYQTDTNLQSIVPDYIYDRLILLRNSLKMLKTNDDMGCPQ